MPYFNGGMNSNDNYGETNRIPEDSNEEKVKRSAQRTTNSPTGNSSQRSSEAEMNYNHQIAMQQREKSSFRAHKTAINSDPYNPNRISNSIQETLSDPA